MKRRNKCVSRAVSKVAKLSTVRTDKANCSVSEVPLGRVSTLPFDVRNDRIYTARRRRRVFMRPYRQCDWTAAWRTLISVASVTTAFGVVTDGKLRCGNGSYLQAGDGLASVPFGAAAKKRYGCVETRPFKTTGSILAVDTVDVKRKRGKVWSLKFKALKFCVIGRVDVVARMCAGCEMVGKAVSWWTSRETIGERKAGWNRNNRSPIWRRNR
jgi:hypothetical protein